VHAILASDRKAAMLIKDIDHAIKALDIVEEQAISTPYPSRMFFASSCHPSCIL
jgi:hypothetical protein